MQFTVQATSSVKRVSECLVLPLSTSSLKPLTGYGKTVNKATDGIIEKVIASGDFSGKQGELQLVHTGSTASYQRVLLVGLGSKPLTDPEFQALLGSLTKELIKIKVKSVSVDYPALAAAAKTQTWAAELLARLTVEATYRFERFKASKKPQSKLQKLILLTASTKSATALRKAMSVGKAVGEGINSAKALGDLPGNICTPAYLASQARSLARKHQGLSCKVLEEKDMRTLAMGSLLSVTAGTKLPAKLIVLNYKGGKKADKPTVLVGKGVTFDSGGISLKPGAGMDEMKYDMCGAASVLGAVEAVCELQLPINLIGIVPAVENMPSGTATRPGDIVTSMSGQTIEVLNTDAEGRLILCDALTYAKRFDPAVVIDIATLTGACVMALGNQATGMLSNDDQLASQLIAAGTNSGDRCWQLPLWPEYDKQLKSNFADMANIGGRNAGTITAACFLARFTKDYPWAHLDIAGTAWNSGASKGATGRPVAMLVDFIQQNA